MSKEVKRFYIMPGSVPALLSGDPAYTPMTNHLTDVHTVPLVLASDYDALLAERDALKAAREGLESMRFRFKHPFSGETHVVEVSRQEVANDMEDTLFEKLADIVCQCESAGETNVVDCNCDDYIYDFELQADEQADSALQGEQP